MIPICLCLRAHQPRRLRAYNYFDVGSRHDYLDAEGDRRRLAHCAENSYAPALELLGRLLDRHARFAFSLALSGPLREQLAEHMPGLLAAFRRLVATGRAEPLAATTHRCLPWISSPRELEEQLALERERARRHLGRDPVVFGGEQPPNPQELAPLLASAGRTGMQLDGCGSLAPGVARRRVYRADDLPVLLADTDGPLTAERFDSWLDASDGDVSSLSLDLATFGLTHRRESGIFEFFEEWVGRALRNQGAEFLTPSEVFARIPARKVLPRSASEPLAANEMQRDASSQLVELEGRIRASGSSALLEDFRGLMASDHFEAMALRRGDSAGIDTDAPESPYEVYMSFRHAVRDLEHRLPRPRPEQSLSAGLLPA